MQKRIWCRCFTLNLTRFFRSNFFKRMRAVAASGFSVSVKSNSKQFLITVLQIVFLPRYLVKSVLKQLKYKSKFGFLSYNLIFDPFPISFFLDRFQNKYVYDVLYFLIASGQHIKKHTLKHMLSNARVTCITVH